MAATQPGPTVVEKPLKEKPPLLPTLRAGKPTWRTINSDPSLQRFTEVKAIRITFPRETTNVNR